MSKRTSRLCGVIVAGRSTFVLDWLLSEAMHPSLVGSRYSDFVFSLVRHHHAPFCIAAVAQCMRGYRLHTTTNVSRICQFAISQFVDCNFFKISFCMIQSSSCFLTYFFYHLMSEWRFSKCLCQGTSHIVRSWCTSRTNWHCRVQALRH